MYDHNKEDRLRETVRDQQASLEKRLEALGELLKEAQFIRHNWADEAECLMLFVRIFYDHNYAWNGVRPLRLAVARWLITKAASPTDKLFDPGLRLLGYIFEEFPELRDEAEATIIRTMARLRWEASSH